MSEGEEETSELLRSTDRITMEARHDHQVANRYHLLHGITLVLGFTFIIMVTVWIYHYRGGLAGPSHPKLEFNWHPLLMVTGLIFMYAQSMLLYRSARNTRKRVLKLFHATLHFTVFIITVIALKAVFDSHNLHKPPLPNMYSLHSWVGLATVLLFSCQFVAGFVTFLYPGFPAELRTGYMHVHTSFGIAGFIMAVISATMGLTEKAIFDISKYQHFVPEAIVLNCIGIFIVAFALLVLYLVNEATYKRVPLPEDEILLASAQMTE